jgi:dipeptidyl aminopeptidase/acylaminoacyl peptidase
MDTAKTCRDFLKQMESLAWLESYTLTESGLPIIAWNEPGGIHLYCCNGTKMEPLCLFSLQLQSHPVACGERVAFFAENPAHNNDLQLYVYDLVTKKLICPHIATSSRQRSVAWLDQKHLITINLSSDGADLVQVDIEDDSTPRKLLSLSGGERWIDPLLAVGPEKRVLLTMRMNNEQHLVLFDCQQETQRILLRGNKSARPITGRWSPDGKQIVCLVQRMQKYEAIVLNLQSGEMQKLNLPSLKGVPIWSPDGQQLVLMLNSWPNSSLALYDLPTQQLTPFPTPAKLIASSPAWYNDNCYFIASSSDQPPALWCWKPQHDLLRRITPQFSVPRLPWPNVLSLPTPPGFNIPCLSYDAQGALPQKGTVLMLHGGPSEYWQIGWNPVALALTLNGYQTILINTRGSTLSSWPLPQIEPGKYGQSEVEDVGYCLEQLCTRGLTKSDKIALIGYSHGAFIAYRSTIHYPQKIRAAVMVSGYMRPEDLLHSRDPEAHAFFYHGFRAEEKQNVLEEKLPTTCPLLLIHGEQDPQIPIQTMITHSRMTTGKKCELVILPGEAHSYRNRKNIIQWIEKALEFIDRAMEEGNTLW